MGDGASVTIGPLDEERRLKRLDSLDWLACGITVTADASERNSGRLLCCSASCSSASSPRLSLLLNLSLAARGPSVSFVPGVVGEATSVSGTPSLLIRPSD